MFFVQKAAQVTVGGGAGEGNGARHLSHPAHLANEHLVAQGFGLSAQKLAQPPVGMVGGNGEGGGGEASAEHSGHPLHPSKAAHLSAHDFGFLVQNGLHSSAGVTVMAIFCPYAQWLLTAQT